jgi:predicted PurR-regulated permease PerM
LFNGAISILSLYFLLSHSKFLVNQIQTGALRLGGPTYRDMLVSIYETLRATLRGILLTSVTQGFLAGIAYFVAGAPFPILLTLLTALSSLLPFGTPFIYVPVALLLISGGASWFTTVAYLVWCIAVVSTADNILRPIFISSVTKISFLLVLFGIIGGLITFGLLGIFVGPVTIVLASQLWRDFVSEDTHISQ